MNLQTFLINIGKFLNDTLVPFLLVLAALAFFWNIAKYFIMEGGNEEAHEKARSYAIWGITAFVVIVSLWGIVNLVVNGLGFGNTTQRGDYIGGRNPNYSNEGRNNGPETNNPDYSNEGRNNLQNNDEDDFFINLPFTNMSSDE